MVADLYNARLFLQSSAEIDKTVLYSPLSLYSARFSSMNGADTLLVHCFDPLSWPACQLHDFQTTV